MTEVKRSCTQDSPVAARIKPMIEGAKLEFKNGIINWHIGNWTNDLEKHDQVLTFKDVFRHYEFENYPLRYNSVKSEKDAQIKIYFVNNDGWIYCEGGKKFKCPFEIDDNTLAVAYAPYGGEWDGHVFVNDNKFWSLRSDEEGKHKLFDTLLHEFGHTHNMGHSTKPKSLMYYQEGANQVWEEDCENLLWNIYKDDRLAALKKTNSGIRLVAYSNEYATTPTTPKKKPNAKARENGKPNWLGVSIYIVVVLAALIISYLMIKK